MHAVAPWAVDTPAFELQVDAPAGNREISYSQDFFVVSPPAPVSTVRTDSCFFRLLSWMTRAYRSPNKPTNFDAAVKPGNAKSARIDLGFFIAQPNRKMKPVFPVTAMVNLLLLQDNASTHYCFSPTRTRVDPFFNYYILRIKNPVIAMSVIAGSRSGNPAFSALLEKCGNATPVASFTVTYAIANVLLTLWGPVIVAVIH